jgi:hypothetical protein
MNGLPPHIQARRAVEDQALRLGNQRRDLNAQTIANTQAIMVLLPKAQAAGVPLEQLAEMVQVSRQTLYRWQEAKRVHDEHHA